MKKQEAIDKLYDLGVDVDNIERVEDGININVFIREELLGELVKLVELTEKLDNS